MIWTSETWLRDLKEHNDRPIRALPIIGEQLHVVGADASGATEVVTWNISRPNGEGAPVLTPLMPGDVQGQPGRMSDPRSLHYPRPEQPDLVIRQCPRLRPLYAPLAQPQEWIRWNQIGI